MKKTGPVLAIVFVVATAFFVARRAPGVAGKIVSLPVARAAITSASLEPSFRLVFPHLADGPAGSRRIRSSLILINRSAYPAEGTVLLHGSDGAPLRLETNRGDESRFEFVLDPGAVWRFDTAGGAELVRGWAEVSSNREITGTGLFQISDNSGGSWATGIAASPPSQSHLIFVDSTNGKDTGVAICNPSQDATAMLRFQLRDMQGEVVRLEQELLSPMGQTAQYWAERFEDPELADFKGVLSVESDWPVSLIALRTRGLSLTHLPSARAPRPEEEGPQELLFARIAEGVFGELEMQTGLILLNPSDAPVDATVELRSDKGGDLPLRLNGNLASRFQVQVPAWGAVELAGEGAISPGRVGWAKVRGGEFLSGAATFSIRQTGGPFISEVGVPDSSVSAAATIYAEEEGDRSTALALTNPGPEEVTIELTLVGSETTASASDAAPRISVQLPAGGHLARFVFQLFPAEPAVQTRNFRGRVESYAFVTRFGEDVPADVGGLSLLTQGVRMTSLPVAVPPVALLPLSAWDPQISELLSQMTLEEKIGQMTLPNFSYLVEEADIERYFLGAVLNGGGTDPPTNSLQDWTDLYDRLQARALNTRLGIPLLHGVDAVHGHNNVLGAVVFPHNIGLGATRNPQLVERIARVTASEVRASGINWTYSPCVAVPQDERWGRTYEGFGEDPELVRSLAGAAVRGYQGWSLNHPLSVVACAKHYLGDGGTVWGTGIPIDRGDVRLPESALRRIHLPGYLAALEEGVASIMASFSSWNGQRMSGHHYLLTTVLKEELGFEGLLVSDWGAIDQLPGNFRSDIRTAVNAGLDMIMVPDRYREFFALLKDLVERGEVQISRIDDAVRRILRVKFASGLFERSPLTDRRLASRFGSPEHRELGRDAVRQSLVLLKNRGGLLPLPKSAGRIVVAGSNADDLGNQCGGWTIDWQGRSGPLTTGTTILQAIRAAVSGETTVVHSPDGQGVGAAEAAVVVVGETPYAEMLGDRADLRLSSADRALIDTLQQQGIPLVIVLVSGRPLILDSVAEQADAILAAWLPGTEGQGVADVIFGDYPPSGRLPCSWPRSMSQIPINRGDPVYDPLYEYGYGLSY